MLWPRQPVHTIYGGAHLFKATTFARLGELARKAMDGFALEGVRAEVLDRVRQKLDREPVEDFRIDFEDGFGVRSDAEEDAAAESAAHSLNDALHAAGAPYLCGIRVKAFEEATKARAVRTLELFLRRVKLPQRFVVTLPKVTRPEEVAELAAMLPPMVGLEVMVETPEAMARLAEIVAAGGRTTAAHFGPYDYTASLGIVAGHQGLRHAACDFARQSMLVALAPSGVWLSDGPTTLLPLGDAAQRGWRAHYHNVRHALVNGFYQGWDLHPAQLPARYAAVFAFFLEALPEASERLRNFVEASARATRVGGLFDDRATGLGLLNTFQRALNCGAITEGEMPGLTGLSAEQVRRGVFT